MSDTLISEQIELQAKLLNYFLGSNKSNLNQKRSTFCTYHAAHCANHSKIGVFKKKESQAKERKKDKQTGEKGVRLQRGVCVAVCVTVSVAVCVAVCVAVRTR